MSTFHSRFRGLIDVEDKTSALGKACDRMALDHRPGATLREAWDHITGEWRRAGRMYPGAIVTPREPDLSTYDRQHTFQPGELLRVEAVTPPPGGLCGVVDPNNPERRGYVAPWTIRYAFADVDEATALASGRWIAAEDVMALARRIDVALNGEEAAHAPLLIDVIVQLETALRRLRSPEPPAGAPDDAT